MGHNNYPHKKKKRKEKKNKEKKIMGHNKFLTTPTT